MPNLVKKYMVCMKLAFISCLIFSIFLSFKVSSKIIEINYKIEFAKLNIGVVAWTLDINDSDLGYSSYINVKSKGMVSGLYSFEGNYSSKGRINKSGVFISEYYSQVWKTKKKKKLVEISFVNSSVSGFSIYPKETVEPKIKYLDLNELNDPISSFINIVFGKKNNNSTIDGRRVYKMLVKNEGGTLEKYIVIADFVNIWKDHARNDLEYIYFEMPSKNNGLSFPNKIKIKNKGVVFKLTRI